MGLRKPLTAKIEIAKLVAGLGDIDRAIFDVECLERMLFWAEMNGIHITPSAITVLADDRVHARQPDLKKETKKPIYDKLCSDYESMGGVDAYENGDIMATVHYLVWLKQLFLGRGDEVISEHYSGLGIQWFEKWAKQRIQDLDLSIGDGCA